MTELERLIMHTNEHPNLIKMEACFQNEENIFFVMELVQGGDLSSLQDKYKRFNENIVKFYAV